MIGSGLLLNYAYSEYQKRTHNPDRPAFETRITEPDVEVLTADGKVRNFQDLKGNVTLILTLPTKANPESEPTLEAVREAMAAFKDAPQKPRILVFVLDGTNTEPAKMSGVLAEFGKEPEVWRVAADDDAKNSLRSFSKTKLRFNRIPTLEDGVFDYDTRLVLLDQNLFVRGVPGSNDGWDFETVKEMEAKFAEAKLTHPDEEIRPLPMTTPKLREMLIKSINYLYENPDEKGQK